MIDVDRKKSCAVLSALALLVAGLLVAPAPVASAAPSLPPGFVVRDQPSGQAAYDLTDFTYLPDNSTLTTGKRGKVAWVSTSGKVNTLGQLPVDTVQDLGLVGVAAAPDYATSRHIYLARAVPDAADGFLLRLARWTVTGGAEPTGLADEQVIFETKSFSDVHAITGIVAAPDGTLWVSIGDLASFRFTDPAAFQTFNPDSPAGKIMHITPDGRGVPNNPFYQPANPSSWRSRVYASGFRSPFRLSLDPTTGTPLVGDVGYGTWEEVDAVRPGQNYKWPCWEGNHPAPGYADRPECANVANTPPVWEYQHGSGTDQGNSVTGGIVYQGQNYPEAYRGAYFFGDYSQSKLWSMRLDSQGNLVQPPQSPPLGTGIGGPVKFEAAPNGDLVYADIYSGALRRLSYSSANSAPVASATTTTDPATRTVTFDGSGSVDFDGDPLRYEWDFGDGTTGSGVHVTHTYAPGTPRFTARLTVRDPFDATGSTDIVVAPSNHSPELTLTPPPQADFAVGDPISLSAQATDAEDGPLEVAWTSSVVHCPEATTCHDHPGDGAQGPVLDTTFTDHPDARMEFTATATDSEGVTTKSTYTALPREHLLTLTSNVPAVLQIPVEGGASSAKVTEGAQLDVLAAATATDGGSTFSRWSDGPTERSRFITMGPADQTLNAEYLSPIDQRYNSDPGVRGLLGAPTGPEITDGPVHYRTYAGGRLYWTKETGVHEVHAGNLAKYLERGGHAFFGAPTTDETSTPDGAGRYNHFAYGASVYWTANTGSHAVWGAIRAQWARLGWETGPIGYPTTDETGTPDRVGRFNHFSKASSIYWTPQTGAHGIWGAIRDLWSRIGWETGPTGYPTTDESITPDGVGRYNHFSKAASIYWTPRTWSHEVYGRIRERWAALGWERSYLGYPTTGEFSVSGGRQNNFERGYIRWYAYNNSVIDRRY
ncbi:PQQ-dependent sugar dehydrogenase [Saccharopolyspora sp. TS4A08]|uniref:PQQ-dependent sugar dehydrogenase n=1 Tax=Saccharopolyspora ipomoeae TaxID=3042027 RepID=A0ABT6PQW8_9PSEU|nr:PQQ-dependent sugar dehydrogenase [Saccharopolyspora sp. TS4A08]MDI2030408.1 PQQ-dependent sugar dehydrogenase [Saccharopolyspora sp. TS4A08]